VYVGRLGGRESVQKRRGYHVGFDLWDLIFLYLVLKLPGIFHHTLVK
jgi:hypothetical protein